MPETAAKPPKRLKSAAKTQPKGQVAISAINAPEAPNKPKIGRPSKYTPEIAQKICEMLSDGIPLREICRQDGFPAWQTIYDWMYRDDELGERGVGLSRAIAHARETGYEAIAEECLRIADTPVMGQKQVMGDDKTYTTVEDMLGHRKLQIETRLKLLAKWNPKKYGDRVQLAGDAENPLKIEASLEADKLMQALLQNAELKKQQ